jgi:hypothetical protein
MAFESGGEIVASRILHLIEENGHRRPVSVFIGKPEPSTAPPGYSCACQIIGIGSQEPCVGHGRDSIQALKSALILLGTNLRNLNAELGGRLIWEGSSADELGLL